MITPAVALAAEGTEIASADDVGNKPHVHMTVNYAFEAKRAAIRREWQRGNADPPATGAYPVVNDLLYKQNRHILTPRLAVGFFDIELAVGLPIILSDTREMSLDQSADPCIFPPSDNPTCVNRMNSSTMLDGILPAEGYDAEDPAANFPTDGTTVFRGIGRSGLDQIHLGLTWAALNQTRDDTKPTWTIGVELRWSIGKIMKFNRNSPGSQDGVSRGVHEFRAVTGLSKRTTWAEPFVYFWWQAPIGLRGDRPEDDDGSLFWDVGYGQETKLPQQEAGTIFGLEAWAFENAAQKQKLTIELQGRISAHFEGRNYSEAWELFAYAGDRMGNPGGPLILDRDPVADGIQEMSHPGVTDIENYLSGAARLGVRGQMGPHAKFGAAFEVAFDQGHIITFTDAGDDKNGNGQVDPGITDPNAVEINPIHKPIIDSVGRRYKVDDSLTFTFIVNGTLMF